MRRLILVLVTILFVSTAVLFVRHHKAVDALTVNGCTNIQANPDYLSSNSAQDAVAAINNARRLEHLHPLHLPRDFYRLDPAQQQFIILNLERSDRGLQPLRLDAALTEMARGYSKQLLSLNFFSHTSPISGSFSDRINSNPAIAHHYSLAAENLAGNPVPGVGPLYEYMYDDAVESCGHRHNLLNPALTIVGIGWLAGSTYGSISAQEFLTPAPWSPSISPVADGNPKVTLSISSNGGHLLRCQALTEDTVGIVRISWFLDSPNTRQLSSGAAWTLDTSRLPLGRHTILVYAVDGNQNFAVASFVLKR